MKTKTIISLFSISLLFFIGLIPIDVSAAVQCSCDGKVFTSVPCDNFLCTSSGGAECECEDLTVEVQSEGFCNGGGVLATFGDLFTGQLPNNTLVCEVVEEEEPIPGEQECVCEAYISSSTVTTSSACSALATLTTNCTWDTSDPNSPKCHCIQTGQSVKDECIPNLVGGFPGNESLFCCTFADGTKTNYEYDDETFANACQEIATGQTPPTDGGTGGTEGTTGGTEGTEGTTGGMGVTQPGEGPTSPIPAEELPNFLGTAEVTEVIGRVVKAVIGISGSAALAVFVYGGALWMFSAGNPDKVKKGRSAMVYAAIGLAVIFLSYALVAFVLRALS